MYSEYDVCLGGRMIGCAEVRREGLYYHIRCHCKLSADTIFRVMIRCGQREENLGILVPGDDAFTLDTRIPVKRIGTGNLSFLAVPRHKSLGDCFVPLCPEEPFRYLSRLKNAYLEIRNGQKGIVIKEPGC